MEAQLGSLGLDVGKSSHSRVDIVDLGLEFSIKRLDGVLDRLIQLLETIINLVSVVCCHFFVKRDEFVKVTDAAVLLITSLVDAMAFFALNLAFGALFCQMLFHVLAWHLHHVACVTRNEFVWTLNQMVLKITRTQRRTVTLIGACEDTLWAFFCNMALVLSKMDVIVCTLVDAFESCPVKHLLNHWVQLCELAEGCLALATLFSAICLDTECTNDFVTASTVPGTDCDIVAVGASGAREHGVRA